MTNLPPLVSRNDLLDINTPFEKDLLGSKKIAETLTGYIDRLRPGAVIGISAPWGEGKSYLGKNWCAQLKATHRVAFIDAFENDYLDDPFLLIASVLSELIQPGEKREELRSRATQVFKAIVPIGTKALINLTGRFLLGSADLSETLADVGKDAAESIADKSEKWLEDRFDDLAVQRASLQGFRDALQEAVAQEKKPVVVFIDELDRCKPSFAVTLIERLKHLFDVPNLVFVLLLNREQLEKSIEGHYGLGTDGQAYLGKFVNLWFDLPRSNLNVNESSYESKQRLGSFVKAALSSFQLPSESADVTSFGDACVLWAQLWKLSLRDVERMCTLFVLGGMRGGPLPTYLIAMKVRNANLFSRLRRMDKAAHLECAEELEALCPDLQNGLPRNYQENMYKAIAELHRVLVEDLTMNDATMLQAWGRDLVSNLHSVDRSFKVITERIDLPVSLV